MAFALGLGLGQYKARQHKTRHNKTTQDNSRQDRARQDKTKQDKTSQDKTRQDKTIQYLVLLDGGATRRALWIRVDGLGLFDGLLLFLQDERRHRQMKPS